MELPTLPQRDRLIALGAVVLLLSGMIPAWFAGEDEETWGFVLFMVLSLVLLGLLMLRLLPQQRAARGPGNPPARAGLIVGVVALVTIIGFWTGLPVVLGAGAIALGLTARDRAPTDGQAGEATAAIVLGALGAALGFVALVSG